MDLSLRSIKTNNWPADNLKNTSPQWVVHLSPQYCQVPLVSGCSFWQLSIDHNMDVHWDVHYKIMVTTIYVKDSINIGTTSSKSFKVLISLLYHWIVLYSGMEMQRARGLFPLLSKLWTIAIDVV